MADHTILTITGDETLLQSLRGQLHDLSGGASRMIVAASIDEACSLLPMARPRLIVVHSTRAGSHVEDLNRLLWATTLLARPVPVLVIADRYRIDQATTLYRMGVSDYISRTHHAERFGPILDAYLQPPSAGRSRKAASSPADPAPTTRTWAAPARSVTAQVV